MIQKLQLRCNFRINYNARIQITIFIVKGFTVKYRPWRIIHTEEFTDKQTAAKREKQLKGGQGRAWIRTNFI